MSSANHACLIKNLLSTTCIKALIMQNVKNGNHAENIIVFVYFPIIDAKAIARFTGQFSRSLHIYFKTISVCLREDRLFRLAWQLQTLTHFITALEVDKRLKRVEPPFSRHFNVRNKLLA